MSDRGSAMSPYPPRSTVLSTLDDGRLGVGAVPDTVRLSIANVRAAVSTLAIEIEGRDHYGVPERTQSALGHAIHGLRLLQCFEKPASRLLREAPGRLVRTATVEDRLRGNRQHPV